MCRRSFLLASAAATVAAAAAKHRMKLHLSAGSIGVKADQNEAIAYAGKYGFDAIDANAGFLTALPDSELQQLLERMKAANIVWGTAGTPVEFRRDDTAFAESLRAFPRIARALERAGVQRMTTWISPASRERTYMDNFRTHVRRLREIARIAGDHGMNFGLEYVGPKTSWTAQRYPFIHSMAEMKDLIADIGRTNVGFVLDSWHWYTAGEAKEDILSLRAHGIVSVDLNDAPAGIPVEQQIDSKRELPMATGVIPVKDFLGALAELGFDGPVRAEPFNEPLRRMPPDQALAATIASLRRAFDLLG